jgi:putative ABC transport system permease protein
MQGFLGELGLALRTLGRHKAFAALAILLLALGMGANAAMFGVVRSVLVSDLRFPDPDRTLRLRDGQRDPGGAVRSFNASSRHVLSLREKATAFDAIIALSGDSVTLTGGGRPERVSVVSYAGEWGPTLGARPILGREFTAEEQRQGGLSGVAQVSYALWQRRFGGDPGVLGALLDLGPRAFTIVGVLPRGFRFPYDADVWIPHALDPGDTVRDFAVFAHLRAGLTPVDARADLERVARLVREEFPDTPPGYTIDAMSLRQNLTDHQEGAMLAVAWVVGLLMALASISVASLLLVRATLRRKELAIRRALGATRGRQLRELLAESLVLASLGWAVGLLLASWFGRVTSLLVPSNIADQLGLASPSLDTPVVLATLGAAIATGLLAGCLPAVLGSRVEPQETLAEGGHGGSTGRSGRRLMGGLVAAEVAVGFVLLAGAGLMLQNFLRLEARALGFDPRGLLTLKVTPPWQDYPNAERRAALARELLAGLRSLPAVEAAGITTVNPLGGGTWSAAVVVDGLNSGPRDEPFTVNHRLVTPGLLSTMGIPILRGRDFGRADTATSEPVVIVSAAMASRFFRGREALGSRVRLARAGSPWLRIVGVSGDVADARDPGDPVESWYMPLDQQAGSRASENFYLMVRTKATASALVPAIEERILGLDRSLVAYEVSSLDRYYADSLSRERLGAGFMGAFGAFGLLVASLGVFAVLALSVTQRTHEVGLRMALGARSGDVLRLILGEGVALITLGLAIGLPLALILNRILAPHLAALSGISWSPVGIAAIVFLLSGALGAWGPARRAAALLPITALHR